MKLENTYNRLIKSTNSINKIQVFVGLSGGVDSSVTAYKLKKAGFDVTGVYMNNFESNEVGCKSKLDRADAIKIAGFLNIPIKIWDFRKEYEKLVIEYFVNSYRKGLTPNPDIYCNKYIKFGLFATKALKEGGDYVATGHYAQIFREKGTRKYYIGSGNDNTKDQSYFLCNIKPKIMPKVLFPLGQTLKENNRKLAKQLQLPVATKKDSTGVCFLHGVDPKKFLESKISERKGVVVNKTGEKIGTHKGAWFYTIGQRHGFQINTYSGKPSYVINKNTDRNVLVVGSKQDLLRNTLKVINFRLKLDKIYFTKLISKNNVYLRIRNLGKFIPITNIEFSNSSEVLLKLETPFSALAPGQFAVIYRFVGTKKIVIGYGEIS